LNKFRFLSLMAWLAILMCASAAFAQTPANISVVSGNGQLICQSCPFNFLTNFAQLVAKVTDANGNPVSGATVNWTITSGGFGGSLAVTTTVTDANGLTNSTFFPAFLQGSGGPFQSYLQTTISASIASAAASFTLTQALQDQTNFSVAPIQVQAVTSPPYPTPTMPLLVGTTIKGQVGSTSNLPIVVAVLTQSGQPVPNVAVNIFNLQTPSTGPVAQCASGAGAGVNTVLTQANGVAVCNPVFGGVPGPTGQFNVVVGGTLSNDPNTLPLAFWYFPQPPQTFNVQVTPGVPGSLKLVSGNSQSAQAGQSLAAPLVVEVDSTAGSGLAGQTVNWSVSPAGAATLGKGASTTTDANGQTSNTLTFPSTANGSVQVTATLSADSTKKFTFTATAIPNITVTGLSIVSGNGQSAIVNTSFGAPLVVQLNATNGTATGVPVQFSVTGPAILSSTTVNTGSNGQASVTVSAGGTAGAVTVTATASGFSQTFNLTVAPPGPTLTANSFMNGADFQRGSLSPCSIATIIATGLAPGLQTMVTANNIVGPLQTKLANDTVTVAGASAPLYSVGRNASGQEQLTFQVPCDVTPGSSVPVTVAVGPGSASINIPIQQASPGIFLTQLTDGQNHPVLVRPDGTFVSIQNPARKGESLVAFATGLGPSAPPVATNAVPAPGAVVSSQYTVIAGMGGVGGVPVTAVQLSSDLVGVWMVTFQVPTDVATGNVAFSIGVVPTGASSQIPSATSTIPVQ
jgi:uncharacterized protein (TIGR03437 family)